MRDLQAIGAVVRDSEGGFEQEAAEATEPQVVVSRPAHWPDRMSSCYSFYRNQRTRTMLETCGSRRAGMPVPPRRIFDGRGGRV